MSLSVLATASMRADVSSWDMAKGAYYRQTADDTAPGGEDGWFVAVNVEADAAGDANLVSISRDGVAGSVPLAYDDGEWSLLKTYESEAAMNAEFPSNANYTISLSGGDLGALSQSVAVGAAVYPNIPYLTGSDLSRFRSIDANAPFSFSWASAGAVTDNIYIELNEKVTGNWLGEVDLGGSDTALTLASGTMTPGYGYDVTIEYGNETVLSGTGGFGVSGYAVHSRALLFDAFTVLSPHVPPIVGAWQFGDGAADNSGILVFQANGTYFNAGDEIGEPGGFDGMERGTYTWDEGTGALVVNVEVDTNGNYGLSHPDGSDTVTVDGDTLTVMDASESSPLTRVYSATNPIVGGWRICDNGSKTTVSNNGANSGVVVFLENGTYFHAEVNDGDPSGQDGMERGTYSWNEGTGVLALSPVVDTNGELGGSHPIPGPNFTAEVFGRKVLRVADEEATFLYRVSNAAVLPDWRLNKARNFSQTADNAAPGPATFWDLWGLVETRNPGDAGAVTIRGGGVVGSLSFNHEEPGEWTVEGDFASQGLLDAQFPDGATYTITLSGGELGTVSQEINIGSLGYPSVPYLTGTDFSDAMSIDPTEDFTFHWNGSGAYSMQLVVSSLPDEEGDEYLNSGILFGGESNLTMPAFSLPAGGDAYGYLEFSHVSATVTGSGGFGISGFSARHSILVDFNLAAQSSGELVSGFAEDAGLSGADALPSATPYDDGISNLLKYAFNMNAGGPDVGGLEAGSGNSGLPAYALDDSGPETVFRVEFVRRKGAGLVYTAKRSTSLDPGSFSPMTGAVTVTDIGDGFERVAVEEPCDPGVTPRCFGTVEVVLP